MIFGAAASSTEIWGPVGLENIFGADAWASTRVGGRHVSFGSDIHGVTRSMPFQAQ
jgi:hypothetical protein